MCALSLPAQIKPGKEHLKEVIFGKAQRTD
jgi:hypothetical protein